MVFVSGEGGIRTLDTLAGISVFETDAFDHSATSPVSVRVGVAGGTNKPLKDVSECQGVVSVGLAMNAVRRL